MTDNMAPPGNSLLLVEDEKLLRGPLVQYLQRRGWEVLEAANGERAWRLLQEKEVRVMVTDLHMPFMDGFALIKEIRLCPRLAGMGIVAMSGSPGPDTRELQRTFPGVVFLGKPFDLPSLEAALERVQAARISF